MKIHVAAVLALVALTASPAVAQTDWQKKRDELRVLSDEVATALQKESDEREAARAAQAKLPGARIGMSSKQVRSRTSWGEPDTINRTITRHGTHEQWVYEGFGYLYFDNGILTAIQN